ncbi:SLATT domain-containing protein [Wohlfahrtiimonas chitiniclastica]|uniref:SLATT domain-containing protein n=1 Tax=Wohlfahrtiimonas chitiniclastica TaxID=400946 RepID=A0AB35C1I1_9GAMM|nr:SLATT domain-containing protein [Wohlfahrtiimonas chitiniclastica]MBS7825261.1 SLATT domain-containing protein [Wohlfahrtiimonas chitiniclastica]MBS7840873.1 SLATT domain-containing protein [Wohlfahrtiimonas chitiniclastica]OYQ82526.1 hypothetical protein B9T14_09735 [Wohlfahrtiimonas chitiniclastica]OYQ83560.1 hypothetical protein B9T15_09765 [Wohlfahrtiimonas chitiniclastica]
MKELSEKIFWTRLARIEAERRLLANLFHAELILVWYALISVGVSIYSLAHENEISQTYWVIFSVLTLACSLYVNTQSYKERAMRIKICYEKLDVLYHRAKTAEDNSSTTSYHMEQLHKKYTRILDICENHLPKDYHRAKMYQWSDKKAVTCLPFRTWKIYTLNVIGRSIIFLFLYTFPLIILMINYNNCV